MSRCQFHSDIPCNSCGYCKINEVIGECCMCGEIIYVGEAYYDVNDELVCDNCDFDFMRQFRKAGA